MHTSTVTSSHSCSEKISSKCIINMMHYGVNSVLEYFLKVLSYTNTAIAIFRLQRSFCEIIIPWEFFF